jgi:hypothetical protein
MSAHPCVSKNRAMNRLTHVKNQGRNASAVSCGLLAAGVYAPWQLVVEHDASGLEDAGEFNEQEVVLY